MNSRIRWGGGRLALLLALVLAAGGLLSACGDDDDGGDSEATASEAPTGSPVTVYFHGPLETEAADLSDVVAAVEARVASINEEGGLNGHELRLEVCNDTDANAELECIRKARSDNAIAFVGSTFAFNPVAAETALGKAGIPSVAASLNSPEEFSGAANYPLTVGIMGILGCPQLMVNETGAKKIAGIAQDLPVQKELLKTLQGLAAVADYEHTTNVTVPVSQTDFSAAVAELADAGADGVVDMLLPATQPAFFAALRSVGAEFKAVCGPNPSYETLDQLGAEAESFHVATGQPATDAGSAESLPLVAQFRTEMEEAADGGNADAELATLNSQGLAFNGWLGVEVLKRVAENVDGELTAKSITKELERTKLDLADAGLPPIDFSKPLPVPGFERLFNPEVKLLRWSAEEQDFVPTDGKSLNVLDLLAALNPAAQG